MAKMNLRRMDGGHYGATDTYNALVAADPRAYAGVNSGGMTQSDLEQNIERSGQWYGSSPDTRYAAQYLTDTYGSKPYSLQRGDLEITNAAEQARTQSLEAARRSFAGLNPDGTPKARAPQAYVTPHAGASLGYDDLYASNKTAYDRPGDGTMNAMSYGPGQQPTSRQQMVDQRNAAGRANVLQRFANANQKMQAMGATANMPRINDVGYGGSPRGMLPPNKQGQGGINNTALMGPGAQPTFRYGVNQNISMPAGSSPGTSAMGYGGSSRPTQGQFGGFQGAQAGGHAPPGMYAQGWQPQQPLPQRMGAGSPGMPGASGGMSGRPMQGQFGTPQPRLANPSWSGISPYVR